MNHAHPLSDQQKLRYYHGPQKHEKRFHDDSPMDQSQQSQEAPSILTFTSALTGVLEPKSNARNLTSLEFLLPLEL